MSPRPGVFAFLETERLDHGVALSYRLDDGPRLVERIDFGAPPVDASPPRLAAIDRAIALLHRIAGVSYYKAKAPDTLTLAPAPDPLEADLLDAVYRQGLAEFAHHNGLDLSALQFPRGAVLAPAPALALPSRALVAIGGGKDSLVSIELLKRAGKDITVAWVGDSELIGVCAAASGLPTLRFDRKLAPELIEMNRAGALNGHIPVTAINSAIFTLAALWFGFDAVVFSNEASADEATLAGPAGPVNHQWSKGLGFERAFAELLRTRIAADLRYFSLLRPLHEIAVCARFAGYPQYHALFSSCNRNFKLHGPRPQSRWCGRCPKCCFVFLALAPFVAKPRLVGIFGKNLLDEPELAEGFDALLEIDGRHRPFECVGSAGESRAAMRALAERADWREDALVARFLRDQQATLPSGPALEHWLARRETVTAPADYLGVLDAP